MDVAHGEAFLALADELHFGRAADKLRVTQPRVSQLIAVLEREIGGKLFERTSRRVALTPLGEQFHALLLPGYAQMQTAPAGARHAARRGLLPVVVGSPFGSPHYRLAKLMFGRAGPLMPSQDTLGGLPTGSAASAWRGPPPEPPRRPGCGPPVPRRKGITMLKHHRLLLASAAAAVIAVTAATGVTAASASPSTRQAVHGTE